MGEVARFSVPVGFGDLLPEEVQRRDRVERELLGRFSAWGYLPFVPSAVEEAKAMRALGVDEAQAFTLIGPHGELLYLRPDGTLPVVRFLKNLLPHMADGPVRLMYAIDVFRRTNGGGERATWRQVGLELVGLAPPWGEVEVLALAEEALSLSGRRFRVAIGHARFFPHLLEVLEVSGGRAASLHAALRERDWVRFRREAALLDPGAREILARFLTWRGEPASVFDRLVREGPWGADLPPPICELKAVGEHLDRIGRGSALYVDLPMLPKHAYYSGIVVEGFVEGMGVPLLVGGRYDALLVWEGEDRGLPALGFAVDAGLLASFLPPPPSPHVVRILFAPERFSEAFREAEEVRRAGRVAVLEPLRDVPWTASAVPPVPAGLGVAESVEVRVFS
ncbi:MAG: ATP phosphoribosyltransferase regulatory subunit [Brockia lithotrophica]|nr:ATP phosphoribosyltransferase regulatory subunit [Brockia lithotrophica]